MMRIVSIVLFALALACASGPTTLAGYGWPVWVIAGLFARSLEGLR